MYSFVSQKLKLMQTEKKGVKVIKTKRLLETVKTPHPTYTDDKMSNNWL